MCFDYLHNINKTHIDSYEVFRNVFSGYDSTVSAVSADATHVCICDNNRKPQYGTVIEDLQAHPGEQFFLQLVVAGGDFSTTTGNVYTSFLNESSTSVLGFSSQQHQVITKNSECSMLNFSAYSNKSHDILLLTTIETLTIKPPQCNSFKCIILRDYHSNCDHTAFKINLRDTPLFINITFLSCPPSSFLVGGPPGYQCHPVLKANGVDCILNRNTIKIIEFNQHLDNSSG